MTEPKIRFKQENGSPYPAWEELSLGTIISDNLDPVPTPKEGYRRVGIYCHAKGTFQEDVNSDEILDVDTMYRIHRDNLIVNITFAWEHAIAIVKPEDEGLLVSHRFPEYSFNKGHISNFYKYLILRPYFKNQLSLASPGGAGRNRVLNKTQFKKIPVIVPCTKEQQKIADFLLTVDEVISASEEEVANLETQKKAVMQKIFSQQVRFKKPDGTDFPDGENVRFGETVTIERGGSPRPIENYITTGEGYNWVKIGDAPEFGNIIMKTAQKIIPEGLRKTRQVYVGDLILSNSMSFGKPYIMGVEGCIHDGWLLIRNDQKKYYLMYLCFLLGSEYMLKQYKSLAGGSAVNNLNKELVSSTTVFIPCLKEQKLIADFLSNFDEAIAAAKKELELWKQLKKALLQQMFV